MRRIHTAFCKALEAKFDDMYFALAKRMAADFYSHALVELRPGCRVKKGYRKRSKAVRSGKICMGPRYKVPEMRGLGDWVE